MGLSITDEQICELKAHVDDIDLNAIAAHDLHMMLWQMSMLMGAICPKAALFTLAQQAAMWGTMPML